MGRKALIEAVRNGIPLVEFTLSFADGVDGMSMTSHLNSVAEDFHLLEKPWYGDPALRVGSATKEALQRMFDWKLHRDLVPSSSQTYWWKETSPPTLPPEIDSIGLSQPGADDLGQWCE